jgi:DNA-binding response OmpR family regulator
MFKPDVLGHTVPNAFDCNLEWLKHAGFEVRSAVDGVKALEAVQAECPDFIVTDWMMPQMDGVEFCRRLRKLSLPHYVYVVMATGRSADDSLIDAMEAGADDFIAKPLDRSILLARLYAGRRVLGLERKLRQLADKDSKAARQAGMAEVAAGVMHNLGNILNSVNVAANLVRESARELNVRPLIRAVDLLDEHADDLAHFVAHDEQGRRLPEYLRHVSEHYDVRQNRVFLHIGELEHHIDQIKELVAVQQSLAGYVKVSQTVSLEEIVNEAVTVIQRDRGNDIRIDCDLQQLPEVHLDQYKLSQILIHLLNNAAESILLAETADRTVHVGLRRTDTDTVRLTVEDHGVGIASQRLAEIFAAGVSTNPHFPDDFPRFGMRFALHP